MFRILCNPSSGCTEYDRIVHTHTTGSKLRCQTSTKHATKYLWITTSNFSQAQLSNLVNTCDEPRPGRTKTVTTPEIINKIHELILEDRRISAKSTDDQLGISRQRVGSIIHEDLDMWKLSAKWVPKCLNADQKRQRCQSSEQLLEFFR